MKIDAYLTIVERKLGIELAPKQAQAVDMAVNNPLSIIVGCAGTGKTTVLKTIINLLYKRGYKSEDIVLMAPTGKAAQRMAEATGHSANTIHSTLGLKADVDVKPEDNIVLNAKMVIVDEFSMTEVDRKTFALKYSSTICSSEISPRNIIFESFINRFIDRMY